MNTLPIELVNIITDYTKQLEVSEKYKKCINEYKKFFKRKETQCLSLNFLKVNKKIHSYSYVFDINTKSFCSKKATVKKHNYECKMVSNIISSNNTISSNGIVYETFYNPTQNYRSLNKNIYNKKNKKIIKKKYKRTYLESLNVKSLKKICKKNNIKKYSKLKRLQLIVLLKKLKK